MCTYMSNLLRLEPHPFDAPPPSPTIPVEIWEAAVRQAGEENGDVEREEKEEKKEEEEETWGNRYFVKLSFSPM